MITLRNLHLQRGGRALFEDVSLTLHAGQKVGITGANGCGKSTLFALLQGELQQDAGDLDCARLIIAHVAQEVPAVERPAIELVLDGDAELRAVEAELAHAHQANDGKRIGSLHARFDAIGGYSARARAAALLHGLGFTPAEQERPVASFSGGWRVRLALAQALMCRSDLLLLDEPTNHLDLDAVLWLEQWLRSYPGTLLLISHDRDFLDNVVDYIAHIEARSVTLYRGNYAEFERQRAARLALQQATHDRQQREIAHIRSFVDRFRAKATKARQAQSRLKALERMEIVAAAHVDSPFHFAFAEPLRCPYPLLRLEGAAAGYGDTTVLRGLSLSLTPGTRLGLLGRNGAGKSTLIKLLAGALDPSTGKRAEGDGLVIGYFAQHQLEQLRAQDSALHHLQRLDPQGNEQSLRGFLGGFGFPGDDALRPVGPMSGGEKARLALALLVYRRPNLLLLDEPTNHLDLGMRDALTVALQDFTGALVVVSHDRYLLRTIAERFMLVTEGRLEPFEGDLEDYRYWLVQERAPRNPDSRDGTQAGAALDRKQQKRVEAEARNRLFQKRRPLERQLAELDRQLERLHQDRLVLESALADPLLYEEGSKDRLKDCLLQQARVVQDLQRTEQAWLDVSEVLEAITEQ